MIPAAIIGVILALAVALWRDARNRWHKVAAVELALTAVFVAIGAWLP